MRPVRFKPPPANLRFPSLCPGFENDGVVHLALLESSQNVSSCWNSSTAAQPTVVQVLTGSQGTASREWPGSVTLLKWEMTCHESKRLCRHQHFLRYPRP